MSLEKALPELNRLPAEDALAVIDALENKRRLNHYAKYFASDNADDPRFQKFFDKIEEDFALFTQDKKIYGILGGNRSSKSQRSTFIAAAFLLGKEYFKDEPSWRYVRHLPIPDRGVNIWVVGLDFNVVRDVLWHEKLRSGQRTPGLLPNDDTIIEKISDSDFRVTVNVNGRRSTLTCKSAEAGREKFQAASVDLILIDEECSKDVFDECYQRTVDCAGKIVISLTPLNDVGSGTSIPWVYDLHRDFLNGASDIQFVSLSVLDNPYIPEDEKKKLLKRWENDPEGQARLYGAFISRAGLVHPSFKKDVHLIPRQNLPRDWYTIVVIDPAPTGPTGAARVRVNPDGDVYLDWVYKKSNHIVSDHARNIVTEISDCAVDYWLIDPRGGNQKNAETHRTCADLYRAEGLPVRFPKFDEEFGRTMLNEYLAANLTPLNRHPRFFAFDDLSAFTHEIERYIWDRFTKGNLKGLTKSAPIKGNEDILQCVHMAVGFLNGKKPPRKFGVSIPTERDRAEYARLNSYS